MLEELARDVTGWGARVVEFFQLLDWNQHLEHLRLQMRRLPGPALERAHDANRRAVGRGDAHGRRPGDQRVGRLVRDPQHRLLPVAAARGAADHDHAARGGRNGVALHVQPARPGRARSSRPGTGRSTGAGRATELTIQDPIRPAALFTDLAAVPAALPPTASAAYYGPDGAARLVVTANGVVVPASDIRCYNLDTWAMLAQPNDALIGIDVARGRLIRGSQRNGQALEVTFCEGTVAEFGGGRVQPRQVAGGRAGPDPGVRRWRRAGGGDRRPDRDRDRPLDHGQPDVRPAAVHQPCGRRAADDRGGRRAPTASRGGRRRARGQDGGQRMRR